MNSSEHLLQCYEEIADFSELMLAAARAGDWVELARLTDYAAIAIIEVRALSLAVALTLDQRRTKLATMQRILANDGQIQELSQPWLKRVARWLSPGGSPSTLFEGIPQ